MARKAKNSNLKRHTHKGRKSRAGRGVTVLNDPAGIRATGARGNARLTSAALTFVSPTPHGPEPRWPAG